MMVGLFEIEAQPVCTGAPRETKVVIVGSVNCAAFFANSCMESVLDPQAKPHKNQLTPTKINNKPNVYFAETQAPGSVSTDWVLMLLNKINHQFTLIIFTLERPHCSWLAIKPEVLFMA